MQKVLTYIAQPFNDGRAGQPYSFVCAMDAEEGGRILLTRADGVLVFQQWVDPVSGITDEPEVLMRLGNLPDGLLSIDPPAPDPWEVDAA